MKKYLLIVITISVFVSNWLVIEARADNTARLSELQKQYQSCLQRIQQYQNIIRNNEAEALRLEGRMAELKEQGEREQLLKVVQDKPKEKTKK